MKPCGAIALCILLAACSSGSSGNPLAAAAGSSSQSSVRNTQSMVATHPNIVPSKHASAADIAAAVVRKYFFFGDTNKVSNVPTGDDGSKTAVMVTTTGQGFPSSSFGGIDFPFVVGTTLNNLNTLSADLQMSFGGCVDGTPRFGASMAAGDTENIFIYPSCSQSSTWANTGNLVCPTCLVDDSQLPGGTFYDTYANAQSKYGTMPIQDFFVVMDTSDPNGQTAFFDNILINSTKLTFER